MQILLVSDLHYTLKQLDWVASVAGRVRPRRPRRRPPRHRVDRRARRADRGRARVPRPHRGQDDRRRVLRATTTSTPRNELGERAARWLEPATAAGVVRRRHALRDRRRPGDRVPVVGRPAHARRSSTASSPRTRPSSATARGSGCTTHRPTRRRRAGPASVTTATRSSSRGSTSHQPDVVLCGHVHQSPFVDRRRAGCDRIGSTMVLERRPPDRPGPHAHRDRHRHAAPRGGRRSRAVEERRSLAGR